MKVLNLNAVSSIRSTGKIVDYLHEYLTRNGLESYVAYSFGPKIRNGFIIGNPFEKKIEALTARITGLQGYTCFWGTLNFIEFLKKIKPDLIHIHNIHSNFLNYLMLFEYILKNKIPVVITLHDCWFFTGKCTHYFTQNCYKWQYTCKKCPELRKDIPSWFFDRTEKMFNDKKSWISSIENLAVTGPSKWIIEEAKKSFLKNAKIIKTIYNPIDTNIFKPSDVTVLKNELKLNDKFIILGVASKFSENNGLDKFIELSKIIDKKTIIVLIGEIDYKNILPSNIIHIKETHNRRELSMYYSLADLYINFAKENTFGLTTAEALACGTPIVVYKTTANSEMLYDVNGFEMKVNQELNDIISIVENIKKNEKEENKQKRFDFVTKNFNKEKIMKEYIELYNKLLKE
ncbi:MAG: glycosyltransferase [bacterium]|nr:glycosyltransferase [bacterium]